MSKSKSKILKGILKPRHWDIVSTESGSNGELIPEIFWTNWKLYFRGRQPTGEAAFLKTHLTKEEYAQLKEIFKQAGGRLTWGSGWQGDSVTFGVKFKTKYEVIEKVKELEALIPKELALKLKVYFKSENYVTHNPELRALRKQLKQKITEISENPRTWMLYDL